MAENWLKQTLSFGWFSFANLTTRDVLSAKMTFTSEPPLGVHSTTAFSSFLDRISKRRSFLKYEFSLTFEIYNVFGCESIGIVDCIWWNF